MEEINWAPAYAGVTRSGSIRLRRGDKGRDCSPSPGGVARIAGTVAGRICLQDRPSTRHNAAMTPPTTAAKPRGLALMFRWQRVSLALGMSSAVGLMLSPTFVAGTSAWQVMCREMVLGMATLIAFGIFEQWPARMPSWIARWAVQVIAVACVVPPTAIAIYFAITSGDTQPFWKNEQRLSGLAMMIVTGLLVGPWTAVAALFRQREFAFQDQAQAFALERSELERKALDSRLRLLQAQVEPHFLFNTLANVRELVVSGSPQAATVLDSLIAYLRAAVAVPADDTAHAGRERCPPRHPSERGRRPHRRERHRTGRALPRGGERYRRRPARRGRVPGHRSRCPSRAPPMGLR